MTSPEPSQTSAVAESLPRNSDLSKYQTSIRSTEDLILFSEAVGAYRAGAPRAAWIMLWLCCAESLKRKFKELAPRDNMAGRVAGEIVRKEELRQSVDAYILDEAKKYGFISNSEHARLRYIYEQRCIFGHPYEEQPRDEALLAAAADVVGVVLSRPTKLRHGFIKEQIRLLTQNSAYIDDLQDSVATYASGVVLRVDESLHQFFLEQLCMALEPIARDESVLVLFRRGVWFAAAYLQAVGISALSGWDPAIDLTKWPETLSRVLATPGVFNSIGGHAGDIVVGLLIQDALASPAQLSRLSELFDGGLLSPRQTDRLRQAVLDLPLASVAQSNVNPAQYVDRIIAELKTLTWPRQNPAIDVVANMGAAGVSRLNMKQQFLLGNNVLQSADGYSKTAILFLRRLGVADPVWPAAFIEGVVTECFLNDEGVIRFKTRVLDHALKTWRAVPEAERLPAADRIVERIRHGRVRLAFGETGARDEAVAAIELLVATDGSFDAFAALAATLRTLSLTLP